MDVIYFEIGDKTCQIPTLKSRRKIETSQRDFLKYRLSLLIYEYGVINCKLCPLVFCISNFALILMYFN